MRILIIGANGFVGRHIVREALNQKHSVIAVYHTHHDYIPKGANIVPFRDINSVSLHASDVIVIASGNYRMSWKDLLQVNVLLPLTVHMLFPKNKIVFVSSIFVHQVDDMVTEQSAIHPTGIYGISKAMGEVVVSSFAKHAIIRFTSVYGVGMRQELFLPTMCKSAKKQSRIVLFGDGTRKQNYLHVTDAARLCYAAIRYTNNGIFLGADAVSYTNTEVAHIVATQKKNVKVVYGGEDSAPSIHIDARRTRKQLSWRPHVTLKEGIKELYEKI